MTGLIKSFYRHVLLDGVAVQETCPLNDHSRADCNINERQHHAPHLLLRLQNTSLAGLSI